MSEAQADPSRKGKRRDKHRRADRTAGEGEASGYRRPRDLASRSDWLFCGHTGDCLVEKPELGLFCSPWATPYSVPLDGGPLARQAGWPLQPPPPPRCRPHARACCADIAHHNRTVVTDMEVRPARHACHALCTVWPTSAERCGSGSG